MSKMLQEAIVDAEALKEAALRNAEMAIIEKYEAEIKDAVSTLLEEAPEDEFALGGDEMGMESDEDIADEIDDLAGDEEEAVEEDSFDLDTIIRELEQEIDEGSYSEEDEEEVEETVIESTETDQDEIIIEEIEVEDEFEDIDVPFAVIEDVPIFPGCESVAKSQRRACFQEQMNKHIRKNFRYPDIAQEMGIQGRVYVNFIIAKDGSITNIRMRGPDKNLENEAARIIGRLPKMTPGKQRGRAVRVPFSIPITFRLQ